MPKDRRDRDPTDAGEDLKQASSDQQQAPSKVVMRRGKLGGSTLAGWQIGRASSSRLASESGAQESERTFAKMVDCKTLSCDLSEYVPRLCKPNVPAECSSSAGYFWSCFLCLFVQLLAVAL
ncbi:hypothetical protein GUITHDRAFT_111118 [Guillardia theta CCMP2712]|uniref:Uncharacterized protein n=1 Tax=Guillardia theta (strain CCMP2712) TaxID=905079 RepID=L1J2J8_GUITC|nr:hypothetical protein GUITHDRAFT_111118 [Guillardia theta CCMP2712]EKX42748.1 hypothetical protein GUITHDRAFT_111118 [Guillardia theta CCMP2712]|eukprot:XP_005829728.1 hypothetical protein GUITHDRAFT_111118 [Guillardia theta CCMP2712]